MTLKRSLIDLEVDADHLVSNEHKRRKFSSTVKAPLDEPKPNSCGSIPAQSLAESSHQQCAELERSIPTREKERKNQKTSPSSSATASIGGWLFDLPTTLEDFEDPETMRRSSPTKRARTASSEGEAPPSETGTKSTVGRDKKNSTYADSRCVPIMESRGSFMRNSSQGPPPDEHRRCMDFLTKEVTLPDDPFSEPQRLHQLLSLMATRSELGVCIDLHSRVVPSIELLALLHPGKFTDLVETHNLPWLEANIFYEKRPQPDRTIAYKSSVLNEVEHHRLSRASRETSFIARTGVMFPFFTCEVKCGKQALATANAANTNSMTVALRMIVDLHRLANNTDAVHRKYLGFSISHDHESIQMYGHYPEIDGDKTLYFRNPIKSYFWHSNPEQDFWTSYKFLWNVCDSFAPQHLKLIRAAIACLPEPLPPPIVPKPASNPQEIVDQSSDAPKPATPGTDHIFAKPELRPSGGITVEMLTQELRESKMRDERNQKQIEEMQRQMNRLLAMMTKTEQPSNEQ